MDDDLAVVERWRNGDRRAGEELCIRYFKEIYRFFEHKLLAEADDLTQQTFLACLKARNQFRGQSTFRTYLYSIARNELYTRIRKIPRAAHVDLEVSSLDALVASPSTRLGQQQELARVRAALRRLSVERQLLLEFHYWHDLDAAALAEVFETSAGTIRVKLSRARQALRAELGATALDHTTDDRRCRLPREPDRAGDDGI